MTKLIKTNREDGQNSVVEAQKIKAEVGQSVTLSCSEPERTTFSLSWSMISGNESFVSNKRYKGRLKFNNNNLVVTITNLTQEDSGTYCCNVETVNIKVERQIMLEVVQATDFEDSEVAPESSEGHSCNVNTLILAMDILRIICLIIISILLGIAVKTS